MDVPLPGRPVLLRRIGPVPVFTSCGQFGGDFRDDRGRVAHAADLDLVRHARRQTAARNRPPARFGSHAVEDVEPRRRATARRLRAGRMLGGEADEAGGQHAQGGLLAVADHQQIAAVLAAGRRPRSGP